MIPSSWETARPASLRFGAGSVIFVKILAVPLAKASWLTVVAVCGIAVVLLAVGGYTGYSIVVGAVGLAAAVNLL